MCSRVYVRHASMVGWTWLNGGVAGEGPHCLHWEGIRREWEVVFALARPG